MDSLEQKSRRVFARVQDALGGAVGNTRVSGNPLAEYPVQIPLT